MDHTFDVLEEYKSGATKFTLIIRDLVDNSFI
jgi:C4-type Zn-finger protein